MDNLPRLGLLALIAVCTSMLIGAVAAAIGAAVYIVVLVPIVTGLATGNLVGRAARKLHLRQARIIGGVGATAGVLAVLSMLATTWSIDRSKLIAQVTTELGGSDAMVERTLELWVRDTAGDTTTIMAPVMYRVHSGLQLFDEQQLDLGLGFNLVLLIFETGLSGYLAWRFTSELVSDPYCTPCQSWTSRRIVGTAALGAVPTILSELKAKQWHRLGRRLGAPTVKSPAALKCYMCDTCERSTVRFELDVTETGKRTKTIWTQNAPYAALQDIWDSQQMTRGDV